MTKLLNANATQTLSYADTMMVHAPGSIVSVLKLGVDLGNGWVKSNGTRFASAVEEGVLPTIGERQAGHHQVSMDGIDFIVGRGSKFITPNRYTREEYKVCLMTAIAREAKRRGIETQDVIVEICVGIPQDLHKLKGYAKQMKEYIESWGTTTVEVDTDIEGGLNAKYNVTIRKVLVFVEGAIVLMTGTMGEVLTMDIGSGTYNAVLWKDGALIADDTKKAGASYIYQQIHLRLKQQFGVEIATDRIEECVMKGEYKLPLGATQQVTDLTAIFDRTIRACVLKIYDKLNETTKFNFDTIQTVQFLGGGATFTFPYWQEILGDKAVLVDNAQYINSEIYEAVINNA